MAGRKGTAMEFFDLTLPLYPGMPVYPGDPPVTVNAVSAVDPAAGEYAVHAVSLGTHTGTHMDAPAHLFPGGAGVDSLPLSACLGPAQVLDCTGLARIDLPDLHARLPEPEPGSRLLLRTDWDHAFGTEEYYHDFPSLTVAAARWLASCRIALLGLETPSLNPEEDHPCHAALLAAGVVLVEGLTGLRHIGAASCWFAALPLPLVGCDGAPVRAVAWR